MIHPKTQQILIEALELTKQMSIFLELLMSAVTGIDEEPEQIKHRRSKVSKIPGRNEIRTFAVGEQRFYPGIITAQSSASLYYMRKFENMNMMSKSATINGVTGVMVARIQ